MPESSVSLRPARGKAGPDARPGPFHSQIRVDKRKAASLPQRSSDPIRSNKKTTMFLNPAITSGPEPARIRLASARSVPSRTPCRPFSWGSGCRGAAWHLMGSDRWPARPRFHRKYLQSNYLWGRHGGGWPRRSDPVGQDQNIALYYLIGRGRIMAISRRNGAEMEKSRHLPPPRSRGIEGSVHARQGFGAIASFGAVRLSRPVIS